MKRLDQDELLAQLESFEAIYLEACKIAKTDKVLTSSAEQACKQIKEMIQKFSEECVKSYKTGYKAGIVNENTRMRKDQPGITEEWIKKKSQLLSNAIQVFVLKAAGELKTNVDSIKVAEDFIRSFIKEIHGRK